ncbi:MAG TPA: AAA family ATPase, partial [Bradyrhizobium sp.]|nr:AAA family ATPase [Bradyrhizobium sp.]
MLAVALGLGRWIDGEPDDGSSGSLDWDDDTDLDPTSRNFEPKAVLADLRRLHKLAERKLRNLGVPVCLKRNITRLSSLVGLSANDAKILEFMVLIYDERLLNDTSEWLGQISSTKVFHVLSVLLDLPEREVRESLSAHGVLARSGLVTVDRSGTSNLRGKVNLLSDQFADHILSSESDPLSLLRDIVAPAAAPSLSLGDYEHIDRSLAVLRPYLRQSLASERRGVNIFLYGDPGTGKSELARVLAADVGCELFEVASEDGDGDPVSGEKRLRAFRAAQSFFAQRRAMIVFDEAEDVFNDGDSFFGKKSTAQTRKAWINRMLEDNPVPALWLSNSIRCLDPAFIRRFDVVIELPVPSKRQRQQIIRNACGDMLDAPAVARVAESEELAPAVVTRAASVVRSIHEELGNTNSAQAIEHLIGNTLVAQGHRPIRHHDPDRLPETYDPAFIHADADLAQVADGLARHREGRLCLYGP